MRKRKTLTPLGETELEVLEHVWALGSATVADVQKRILNNRTVAYTTVMTVMKNLADKGYLTFVEEGNAYVYSAQKSEKDVKHGILRQMVDKVFQGSPTALVQSLVAHEKLSEEEREELRKLLKEL